MAVLYNIATNEDCDGVSTFITCCSQPNISVCFLIMHSLICRLFICLRSLCQAFDCIAKFYVSHVCDCNRWKECGTNHGFIKKTLTY